MSSQQPPTADQLAAARLAHWHQNTSAPAPVDAAAAPAEEASAEPATPPAEDGSEPAEAAASPETRKSAAILTMEDARQFVASTGLLLFTPRPQLMAAPAPTFVEATLGVANSAPSLAQTDTARSLMMRLVAEGVAVPLNLLGAPQTTPDSPDFLASAAVFSFVFTLRGDKLWKQPPVTSGATKVSPLALKTYELIQEHGATSAYDLATQLGREVTEAAVLRGLNELWQHLRVIPVLQHSGNTLWELATTRLTKQIKSGVNAGVPTALSALISLYLGQAILASEDDVQTFLSPLSPRSRVREVLHALVAGRQLDSVVIEGKHLLHVHGELPNMASFSPAREASEATASGPELAEDGSRIKKFVPKSRKVGTGYVERSKPFQKPGSDRERRPFTRDASRPVRRPAAADRAGRPEFNKPWDEERKARSERAPFRRPAADAGGEGGADARPGRPERRSARPAFGDRSRPGPGGDRPSFGRRPGAGAGGDRPAFGRKRPGEGEDAGRPPRREFGARPPRDFGARPPRDSSNFSARPPRDFGGRPPRAGAGEGAEGRAPRRPFDPDRPRKSFAGREGSAPRGGSFPRRDREGAEGGGRPPFRKFDAPKRPFTPRAPREGGDADARPPRREFGAGAGGDRGGFAPKRTFGKGPAREGGGFAGRREGGPPAGRREGGFAGKREGGFAGKREGGFAGKREGGSFAGKTGAGPRREGGFSAARKGPAAKAGGFGKKPFGRAGVDAPGANTFDKFKGGNKPWGKRPPARKHKPEEGEA